MLEQANCIDALLQVCEHLPLGGGRTAVEEASWLAEGKLGHDIVAVVGGQVVDHNRLACGPGQAVEQQVGELVKLGMVRCEHCQGEVRTGSEPSTAAHAGLRCFMEVSHSLRLRLWRSLLVVVLTESSKLS